MELLLKNCLLRNKKKRTIVLFIFIAYCFVGWSQTVNYINNGGFEELVTNTATPYFPAPKYWGATDSSKFFAEVLSKTFVPVKVPLCSYTYQWTRHGDNDVIGLQYCPTCANNKRGYPRNRLKQVLKPNTAYCFSMYINLSNQSTHAIDAIGVYFADASIDTITQCNKPITYLTPQIENPVNNFITDTLRWVLIRGQFIANGTEKYAMIGNFKSDTNTNTVLVNPTHLPSNFSDYLIDDVSLIELNLPAFAGRDTVVFAGDSVFLGRESDVGIDEACLWYKLPTTITPTTPAIDTIAGFWVKPVVTSTYVVKQEICGLVKWDTVTIYMDAVGIEKLKILNDELKIYPIPTSNFFQLQISNTDLFKEFNSLKIYNNLGQLVREEEIKFENKTAIININDLANGVYVITLANPNNETVTKKLLIAK